MKRILLATVGTVAGLVSLLSFKTQSHPLATPAGGLPSAGVAGGNPGTGQNARPARHHTSGGGTAPTPSKSPASKHSSAPSTSSYTGSAINTPYGIVQVKVTVSGSRLTNASFVQLTAFDSTSQQINSYAAPILLRQTMKAQSAHIDGVSGATYTSAGYVQSLQSALNAAGLR